MIGYTGHRTVRISRTAQRVCVLVAPLDVHQTVSPRRTELGDEILLWSSRSGSVTIRGAESGIETAGIRRESAVMVILGYDRIRPVVLVDCRGDIPSEIEVGQELPCGAEPHQVSLIVVEIGRASC